MRIFTALINLLPLVTVISFLSPETEAQQPNYIDHVCPNTTTFSGNSSYRANRDTLLSSLSSNVTRGDGFYNTTSGRAADMVYGLFLCRGDLNTSVCQACVAYAATDISRRCPVETTAVVWYDECLLRYSNQNIFSVVAMNPDVLMFNPQNVSEQKYYNQILAADALLSLNKIATEAANTPPGAKKYAANATAANFSRNQTLYTLGQCTPDVSSADCGGCLRSLIEKLQRTSQGERLLTPSCNVRYEIYSFFAAPPPLPPAPEEENQNESNRTPVLVATLLATFGLLAVSLSGFFIWRRRNSREDTGNSQGGQFLDMVEGRIPSDYSRETFSGENGDRSQDFPSIQLDILHAATNHFSDQQRLGEGGFGPVYKGILPDGKEIAVKRLSRTSGQGLVEFKNEVMLIARLQHRNLVRLLGCCLEKNEKLLVYEFMPNKSLDVFIFNSKFAVQLDWQKRFNIIKGIARGILYLHEDSRLRIIHRDLKASNVLLDHEMNPKISDFGMARIFVDKHEENTNRVVGTYGYMAPEYAMQGLFSIKSDVFSFGVILLEIISGKKNNSFHLSETGESLLAFAWKLWCKGEGMELIDQMLVPSCVASEALKCFHIGLLCVQEDPADRPTMASVIFMLASDGNTSLPQPTGPAFSVGRMVSEASEPISNDGVCSVNEVTISNFLPR